MACNDRDFSLLDFLSIRILDSNHEFLLILIIFPDVCIHIFSIINIILKWIHPFQFPRYSKRRKREREKDQSSEISRSSSVDWAERSSKYPKRCAINSRLRAVEKVEPTLKKVTLWRDVLGERRAGA